MTDKGIHSYNFNHDISLHDAQIRAEAIDEVLSHTKTIVDEDGIIHEVVLVKDIEKIKEKQNGQM